MPVYLNAFEALTERLVGSNQLQQRLALMDSHCIGEHSLTLDGLQRAERQNSHLCERSRSPLRLLLIGPMKQPHSWGS